MYEYVYSVTQFMPYISIQGVCYNIIIILSRLHTSGTSGNVQR